MSARIFEAMSDGRFQTPDWNCRCALGKQGVIPADKKREGDNKSPLGDWPIRFVFYRPDRESVPQTDIPSAPLTPMDGWCDDVKAGSAYNRHVLLPFPHSCERLWREDHVYDFIIVLGHNDSPAIPGRGSAIFMHLKRGEYEGTEGCVALARDDLLRVLAEAKAGDIVRISS
ncbi:MAG: hypothetical protein CME88_10890 [Hirschia sp.]|nr:hypothetical protein [Hirschia sp.]MBF18873.1 hypothetical protein [Hirschia sp.]|tara:strand:+ start:607 stop:1122 length:516 start_codon:yes stop_codon:yes gene_type:complete